MSLNFNDGKWSQFTITFSWPHQAFLLGWNIAEPTKQDPYFTVSIHLGPIAVAYEWGDNDWEINE
jgi:hypothetical protein